jgi:hypothetical protein
MRGRIILPAGATIVERSDGWHHIHNPRGPANCTTFRHYDRLLTAIHSIDNGRHHLSVSHRDRIPTWEELGFARDSLLPADLWLMIAHPPRKYWLNYNSRVLHLWEFNDPLLIGEFKAEGELAQRLGYGVPDSGVQP